MSNLSKEKSPLIIHKGELDAHFEAMNNIISEKLDTTVKAQIFIDWNISPIAAGLVGEGCETIQRNRGGKVYVVPIKDLKKDFWAWISYYEQWDEERPSKKNRRFSYRSTNLTVYFGKKNNNFKPQIFRIEWAGYARWLGSEYTQQAPNAGHPHWQFDVLDSLTDEIGKQASDLKKTLENPQDELSKPQDFNPYALEMDIKDILSSQKLSNMHFASAAAWWKNPQTDNDHVHSPNSLKEIQVWIKQSLTYIYMELGRL